MTKNSIIQKITIAFLLALSLKGFSQQTKLLPLYEGYTVNSKASNGRVTDLHTEKASVWNGARYRHFYLRFDIASLNLPDGSKITKAEIINFSQSHKKFFELDLI